MTQQTTIPTKVSGDYLSAGEFNDLNDVVNYNSDYATANISSLSSNYTELSSRVTTIEDTNTSNIQVYNTSDLPTGLTNGTIVYDASSEVPVYTNDNQWYRCSDSAALSSFTEVDMFIVMGQSNADGKADFTQLDSQTGRTLQSLDRTGTLIHLSSIDQVSREYIEGTWQDINPGTNTAFQNNRFGPEVGFTDTVKAIVDGGGNATYSKPVAVFKFVKGATSLATNWAAPSGDCYTAMIQDIPNGKFDLGQYQSGYKFNIRGMIWYQGENDALNEDDANNYETNLTNFIADVRNRFNRPTLPIMICKVSYESSPPTYLDTVRQAQQNVADADPNIDIIDTQPYDRRLNDVVHLNAKGMYELGEDIFTNWTSV